MASINFNTRLSQHLTSIILSSNHLLDLADSFEDVGNDKVANRLRDKGEAIINRANQITKDWSDFLNQEVQLSMSAIGETLKSLLQEKE